jgi:hypothetical protein
MPFNNLRMSERDWSQLRRVCQGSFEPGASEVGAIGLVGSCERNGGREYLVSEILLPRRGEVKESDQRALVFDASGQKRGHSSI